MPFVYVQDVYHKNQFGTWSVEKEVQRALTELLGVWAPQQGIYEASP